ETVSIVKIVKARMCIRNSLGICAAQHTVRAQNVFRIGVGFSDRKQTGPFFTPVNSRSRVGSLVTRPTVSRGGALSDQVHVRRRFARLAAIPRFALRRAVPAQVFPQDAPSVLNGTNERI